MPTTKPRHAITENEQVSAALAVAAQRWPADQDRPTRLLLRLIEEGRRSIEPGVRVDLQHRREQIRLTGGVLSGVYGVGYLDRLREDWPE